MPTEDENAAVDTAAEIRGWCLGTLPDGWFAGPPEVTVDREEITVVGQLPPVTGESADRGEPADAGAGPVETGSGYAETGPGSAEMGPGSAETGVDAGAGPVAA